jgi:hypothetical protein
MSQSPLRPNIILMPPGLMRAGLCLPLTPWWSSLGFWNGSSPDYLGCSRSLTKPRGSYFASFFSPLRPSVLCGIVRLALGRSPLSLEKEDHVARV